MTVKQGSLTEVVSAYAAATSFEQIPPEVREQAKKVVFDEILCAAFGNGQPAGRLAARYALQFPALREALVIGTAIPVAAPFAALANGTAGHADEIDGAHSVGGHPGATIVHSALALAERQQTSGAAFLNAVVLAYDIGTRLIKACGGTFGLKDEHHLHADFLHAIGAAVANARLLDLDPSAYRHSAALATFQANGLCVLFQERSHLSKAFCNGQYAFAAITAALLAQAGMEGADDVIGGDHGLLDAWGAPRGVGALIDGLGREYAIMHANFKFMRAGYPIHAAVEAGLDLLRTNGIRWEDLTSIHVGMPENALQVVDNRQMHNICIQDMLSVALLHGQLDLNRSYFPEALDDQRFWQLRKIVTVSVDVDLQNDEPNGRGARVTLMTHSGRPVSRRVDAPRGHSSRGAVSWTDLSDKWRAAMPNVDVDTLITLARHLEDLDDLRTITSLLAPTSFTT